MMVIVIEMFLKHLFTNEGDFSKKKHFLDTYYSVSSSVFFEQMSLGSIDELFH